MQTILGANGAIGIELAKALGKYTSEIRLVSRNPQKVNDADQLLSADLTESEEVNKAVDGSSIVYCTVGFPYSTKVWQSTWPVVMRNIIKACKKHQARLVFFDNIYMYDCSQLGAMSEDTAMNPCSKKGEVRKAIVDMILQEIEKGGLKALIARSADFYGPSIKNTSVLTETVFKNLSEGKKADWMCSLDCKHSFTYTPDAGIATALLGNTEEAYNQVWHLPTASNPPMGREWVELIATEMGVNAKSRAIPRWMVKLIGLFVPIMKEMYEMLYQYDRDYVFDSSKFEKQFDFNPTSYEEGVKHIIATDYK